MFGLLNIAKPAGVTSRDVVNRVQRIVRPHKAGHAGTLDPLATGVLVVGIGPATRLVEYVQRMPKTYLGTFLCGRTSDTEDIEGVVALLPDATVPTLEQLRAALPQFLGTIQQTPPAYSALKVAGQRAHALARRGETVELAARPVEIHDIQLVSYAYPEIQLLVRCGSGTYIRSLGRDIARSLGTGAVMSALVRQAIGSFQLADALAMDALSLDLILQRLLSPRLAVSYLPHITLSETECRALLFGQQIDNRFAIDEPEIAALNGANELVAIVAPTPAGRLATAKGFAPANQPE